MAYKADHYTSDNLDKREEDRILKQLGEKEMSVEDWKKIFKFKVAKGKAVITKYLGADTVVEIPSTIGPNVVVGISSKAFGGCKNITNIIFPKTLTCIEQLAFHGCTGLVYNEYNNGYYLGSRDNPYLVFMRIKSQLDPSCELHKDTKIISCAAFYGCSFLEEVILPHGVEIICDGAFRECKVLKSITIPNTVTHIGKCLFWSSNKLTSIEIPDSVVNADPSTFLGSGFKKISLPASLSEFTQDKFCYFTKITVRKK
jgi:hypothetical protein